MAVGLYASETEAIGRMVRLAQRFEPEPGQRATYDALYARYRQAEESVVSLGCTDLQ